MRILYLDCFSGISGDMCLAALIDAGVDQNILRGELRKIPLQHWDLNFSKENSYGITGTRAKVTIGNGRQPHRHFTDIIKIIRDSSLPENVKDLSINIFSRLAVAEGKVHGVPAEDVHFHEVGAVDSIIDIIGTSLAVSLLNVDRIICSPLPTGSGYVRCRHGLLPVPAPATAELLKGVPLRGTDVEGELVTPTGAAIATTLSVEFGSRPEMKLTDIGYGLGSNDYGIPNFLRVFLGNQAGRENLSDIEPIVVIETNIDDMNPEFFGHVMDRLAESGALDVFVSPAYMKKNRPGHIITTLCRPADRDALIKIMLEETTTLGVRFREEKRAVLKRSIEEIETSYGKVRVKFALSGEGKRIKAAPEYEDCKKIAREKGIPIKAVYGAALRESEKSG
jgi:uncharacterized protein (TIGR00299 family) protein